MDSQDDEIETTTGKTLQDKKTEKREKNKLKKLAKRQQDKQEDDDTTNENDNGIKEKVNDAKPEVKKPPKSKKPVDKNESKENKKRPGKKAIAAIQEALRKQKEEEEKQIKEEEERIRRLEEAEEARRLEIQKEKERKERKKQRDKDRKEKLKAEGKYLTAKQRFDRQRAIATIEALKAQGMAIGVGTGKRQKDEKKIIQEEKVEQEPEIEDEAEDVEDEEQENEVNEDNESTTEEEVEEVESEDDGVKESWDMDLESDNEKEKGKGRKSVAKGIAEKNNKVETPENGNQAESPKESDSESECDTEDEEKSKSMLEARRERAMLRIKERKKMAETNKDHDNLRAAVVCVLGHVDTGKTKILDKLRRTNVQDAEAGGITQQIGATNVPIDAIKEQTRIVKESQKLDMKIPGLLIIDTPGHESFSNLRNRGSSLCDIAILVVDIMHGLEPQTIESISILKSKKTPFIVALNKIDRLYNWNTMIRKDIRDTLKMQEPGTQAEFEKRTNDVIVQFAEQGLNAELFYKNPDTRSYVSLVPTSAITGEGMGNLLYLIVENCQNILRKRLVFTEELQATVLEVKSITGHGFTIDVILVNGYLREGDTMVLAGFDGPIVTQIRSLLMPQPLKELRVKNAYTEYKEVKGAQGIKIAAKDLDKAIAGINVQIAEKPDEIEILKEEVSKELHSALSKIKVQERGVYVQASTLGSLEALVEFLKSSKIPFSNIRIGPVVRRDVMKASIMLEHDPQYATILAFDVRIERDAQELADNLGVKIFQANIIYHLFDSFTQYREELKMRKREEFKDIAVFPCKLKILPQFVFNSRDPIVCGVIVEAGIVKVGTPICVPSKEFINVGIVTSIESNHKPVESARKGSEVCVKIENTPGETPKLFGRHFDETDYLVSKISRQSIDACKEYFRDDLLKQDWQLMVELKKLFEIL